MSRQTVKEVLKPPFKPEYDLCRFGNSLLSVSVHSGGLNTEGLCLEVRQWLMDAVTEKWERLFGKKLRWQKDVGYHFCPECKRVFNDERNPIKEYKFCPYCGQPLDQPLEELLIGEKVKMVKCLEAEKYKDRVWIVASEPWKVGDSWVVRLNGYSGGFDIECLEVVK